MEIPTEDYGSDFQNGEGYRGQFQDSKKELKTARPQKQILTLLSKSLLCITEEGRNMDGSKWLGS